MVVTANSIQYRALLIVISFFVMALAFVPAVFAEDPLGIDAVGQGDFILSQGEGDDGLINTVTSIINVALGLLGIVAVVIILVAGFKWMTAGGNEEQVAEAKKRISQGVIGLAIILASYAIANFVISELSTATGVGG